jgi:hypothetical protein
MYNAAGPLWADRFFTYHVRFTGLIARVTLAALDLVHNLREVVARRCLHRRERLKRLEPLQPKFLTKGQHVPVVNVGGARSRERAAQARGGLRVEAHCLFERVALDVLHPGPVKLNKRKKADWIFWCNIVILHVIVD